MARPVMVQPSPMERNDPFDPDFVSKHRTNLFELFTATGKIDEAEVLIQEELDAERQSRLLVKLASSLEECGRLDEAEGQLRQALEIREKKVGKQDETLVVILTGLAKLLARHKRFDEAEWLTQRARRIQERED